MTDPAPTDDPWLGIEGGYVHRPIRQQHVCELPAEWIEGAVWQCPDGHLWVVGYPPAPRFGYSAQLLEWRPIGLARLVVLAVLGKIARRPKVPTPDMANGNRTRQIKPPPRSAGLIAPAGDDAP